jgi:HKD family nuclease
VGVGGVRVQVVDNKARTMVSALSSMIEGTSDLRMAVAFLSKRGLGMIDAPLMPIVDAGTPVEFLVGLDMLTTEPVALRQLFQLCQSNKNANLYCLGSLAGGGIYHPKLYVSRAGNSVMSIVGSSNLTTGGLKTNVEVNVLIEADAGEELVSDIYTAYNRLKFHPQRVEPDEELVALYAEVCKAEKQERRVQPRTLREALDKKVRSLRRPTPTRRDLVGWLELVYDSLPDGEFANTDIYRHEAEFHNRFPANRNIRAKVRQQLQVLEAIGFLEHVRTGRWRKL